MDLKTIKYQIFHGSFARRMLLRAFMIASAVSMFPLLQMWSGNDPAMFSSVHFRDCADGLGGSVRYPFQGADSVGNRFLMHILGSSAYVQCREYVNLTVGVVEELMSKNLLEYNAKALCAGEGSGACVQVLRDMGFSNALGVSRYPLFSFKQKHAFELDYKDSSFDFVFSGDFDKVSVPALLVLEIERVLKPGGIGAMLVGVSGSNRNSLIRSASPVSSLLKTSSVVHVGFMNDFTRATVNGFTLVVFKKRFENAGYFGQLRLPADCPSVANSKPFIDSMEPLLKKKPLASERKYSYLPNFLDISVRMRLVYINIGAGEHMSSSVSNWFLPSYPVDIKAFNVYFVDHNTSVLLSYVKKPGVTFVYHPGLRGNKDGSAFTSDHDLDPYDELFDFLAWFKETVDYADFVVLKMNTGELELKFIQELLESGTICSIDELFLHCSDPIHGLGAVNANCMDLFNGLRSVGVFVHQWWVN